MAQGNGTWTARADGAEQIVGKGGRWVSVPGCAVTWEPDPPPPVIVPPVIINKAAAPAPAPKPAAAFDQTRFASIISKTVREFVEKRIDVALRVEARVILATELQARVGGMADTLQSATRALSVHEQGIRVLVKRVDALRDELARQKAAKL